MAFEHQNVFETDIKYVIDRAIKSGKRDLWLEPLIVKNPNAITKVPFRAYCYAHSVIKGRWPEAEPYIRKDPWSAYEYALYLVGGRWPEAEPYIVKNPKWAHWYARRVIKGR